MTQATPEITRLFGGPGSGKTTALLDRVETLLEDETVTVDDLLVVSYTRAAAAEVRDRLADRLDVSAQSLKGNVGTMHAKAYELLGLSGADVVGEPEMQAFCEDFGLEYEDEYRSARRRTARSRTIGNKIIATSQWLQRTRRSVDEWYEVPFQWDVEEVRLPPEIDPHAMEGNKYTPTWSASDDRIDVPEAIEAWRAYKQEEGLTGFADMLEAVLEQELVPDARVLIIDEFQDITTLQYLVYELWKPHMETILIAGDDDQVVYEWQGADPALLLDADRTEDVILPNSYRLPSRVLEVVNTEIRHLDRRQEKDLKPRKEGGDVEARSNPSMLDVVRDVRTTIAADAETTVMVLFRARYQLFQFLDEFIGEGIPFRMLTEQRMWTDRLTEYVRAVEAMAAGETVTGLQTRRLADMLQDSAFGTNERDALFELVDTHMEQSAETALSRLEIPVAEIRVIAPFAPAPEAAADMVRKVTSYQRKSIDAYFDGPHGGMDPGRVRVGTIHSAKGREADHVYLATDLTEKVVEQIAATISDGPEDGVPFELQDGRVPALTDSERRVFFVGMSRARERLVLLEDLISGAPTLPVSVLLHNELRETPVEELVGAVAGDTVSPEA
jgi:DNA helicase-2/ATP-dependent DNA helicase PcrA